MKYITKHGEIVTKRFRDYVMITIAAIIYGISISLFLDPNNIAPGGVTGIAILINRFVNVKVGTLYLLINIPIVLLGLWKFGIRFIISTMYAIGAVTVCTNYFAQYPAMTEDLLIAAVIGGGLLAISLALIFLAGATTGGTDIVVKVMRLKWRHMKTGMLFLISDAIVVLASWAVFGDLTVAFYAGVAVVVDSLVMDLVLYGADEAKLIYIITDNPHKIKKRIMDELDITATIIEAKGAYTNENKEIIMVVMRKTMAPMAQEIVKEEDSKAFMIVSSASEIFGEGYKDIKKRDV